MQHFDVIIIGAGAAGLMCAIEAGRRNRRVLVIDHANKPGKKILMSGGGRCNFTNYHIHPDKFISYNPHFCKSALSRYTQWDFIELVKKHHIPFHEKTLGQLFCDNKSQDILQMLLDECRQTNVEIRLNTTIAQIKKMNENIFQINTSLKARHSKNADSGEDFDVESCHSDTKVYHCDSCVIATGGLSIPTMGASAFGYKIAEQFGIKVWPTRAGLVPFTLQEPDLKKYSILSGVAVNSSVSTQTYCAVDSRSEAAMLSRTNKNYSEDAKLSCTDKNYSEDAKLSRTDKNYSEDAKLSRTEKNFSDTIPLSYSRVVNSVNNSETTFSENILFTHRGLSGPAILQISSYWNPGNFIEINLLPGINIFEYLCSQKSQNSLKQLKTALVERLPKRVIEVFFDKTVEKNLAEISIEELKIIATRLSAWIIKPNGTEGYRTAEVTLGGVDCNALSSKTMETNSVKGLYFIGEVVDVTGWLGGYNFQWAWSSGWAAGQVV